MSATTKFIPLRFTEAEAESANESWGLNCGPASIAAVCGLTLDELRPNLGTFEAKGYTNPTLMWEILDRLGVRFEKLSGGLTWWPHYGLARIQWHGPWTSPGVPARAAYRYTHWVGANSEDPSNIGIFDINSINSGGWIPLKLWESVCVPHILKGYPKSNGKWSITHLVEVRI